MKGLYTDLIEWINGQNSYIFAIDIPSGLSGDYSDINGPAVKADKTLTMGLPKLSQYFYPAKSFVGELEVMEIGFPAEIEEDTQVNIHIVIPLALLLG